MTVAKHGVSSNTPERYVFGAGVVYTGYTSVASPGTLLGASKGGAVLEINRTIRDIRPDGAKGPVKGFRRIEEVEVTLTVELLEITEANLLKALAGSSATSHVITGAEIDDADFADIGFVVDHSGFTMTSAPLAVKLSNCIVDGPVVFGTKNNEEMVMSIKFRAHFADSDLDTEPWEITYPS